MLLLACRSDIHPVSSPQTDCASIWWIPFIELHMLTFFPHTDIRTEHYPWHCQTNGFTSSSLTVCPQTEYLLDCLSASFPTHIFTSHTSGVPRWQWRQGSPLKFTFLILHTASSWSSLKGESVQKFTHCSIHLFSLVGLAAGKVGYSRCPSPVSILRQDELWNLSSQFWVHPGVTPKITFQGKAPREASVSDDWTASVGSFWHSLQMPGLRTLSLKMRQATLWRQLICICNQIFSVTTKSSW